MSRAEGRRSNRALACLFAGLVVASLLMAWGASEAERRPWLVAGAFGGVAMLWLSWRFGQGWAGPASVWVLAGGLLLRTIFAPLGGELSDDFHRYLWDGGVVRAGENPYAKLPIEWRDDPRFQTEEAEAHLAAMNSPRYHSIYPPLSQCLFAAAGLGGYWGLKLAFALAELGALLLLARLLPASSLLLVAWNPMLILETWGQPHTEALALLLIVVGLAAWQQGRRPRLATAAIILAACVKLFPVLLLPFLWRRVSVAERWRCLLIALAIAGTLSLPFLDWRTITHPLESSHLYMLSFEFNAGLYYLIKWLSTEALQVFGWIGEGQDTSKVVGPLMRVLLVVGLAWLWRRDRGGSQGFAGVCVGVLAIFLLTFVNLHPWYLVYAFALLPWLPEAARPAWLWLGACSIGTYLSYSHDVYWPFVVAGWAGFVLLWFAGLRRGAAVRTPRSAP